MNYIGIDFNKVKEFNELSQELLIFIFLNIFHVKRLKVGINGIKSMLWACTRTKNGERTPYRAVTSTV